MQQTLSVTQKEGFRLENILYELLFLVSRLQAYFHKYFEVSFFFKFVVLRPPFTTKIQAYYKH